MRALLLTYGYGSASPEIRLLCSNTAVAPGIGNTPYIGFAE